MDLLEKAKILDKRNKEIIEWRKQGLSYRAIAEKIGLSAQTVKKVCDKANLHRCYK